MSVFQIVASGRRGRGKVLTFDPNLLQRVDPVVPEKRFVRQMIFGEFHSTDSLRAKATLRAYTVVEVLVAVFVLTIMIISLYGGFSAGFAVVQLARENMRATQIMVQRLETMRLYNWEQVRNTSNFLKPTFLDSYDPSSPNAGTLYSGYVSTNAPAVGNAPYSTNMRTVTVTLFWTNYQHGSMRTIVRQRQMQTHVARYGMQNYLYQ
jgi:Tfp pilus assembly protein PilV